MPFFVVSHSPGGRPIREPGDTTRQFDLLGGASDGHDTREEAERAAARLRGTQPDREHVVIEAGSALEALLRAQHPGVEQPSLSIETVTSWYQMLMALAVRRAVFIDEQQVPEEEEIDEHDLPRAWGHTAVHVVGRLDGVPVATARLLLDAEPGGLPHIGRVAVVEEFRGRGHGRTVMDFLHRTAQDRGYPGVTLAAQLHAVPFYERLGYVARGPVFLDAGIEHRDMDLVWD